MAIQPALFPKLMTDTVVNVASVKHLSPFRYPGGKTWLVPRIRGWLYERETRPSVFVEPFCGGGIVSLSVAHERLAERVVMAELDDDVASVWQTLLSDDAEWLARRIIDFDFTAENVAEVVGQQPSTAKTRAFKTILRNRVNHGGILAPGSGTIKQGEKGKGLSSRWYPETLAKRIRYISSIRERIDFVHGDAMAVIENYARDGDAAFFIDPPYTASEKKAGSRLYTHSELDHDALFELVEGVAGDFVMSYDHTEEVRRLAERHRFDREAVAMKNTHHAKMTELLIGRDLGWMR